MCGDALRTVFTAFLKHLRSIHFLLNLPIPLMRKKPLLSVLHNSVWHTRKLLQFCPWKSQAAVLQDLFASVWSRNNLDEWFLYRTGKQVHVPVTFLSLHFVKTRTMLNRLKGNLYTNPMINECQKGGQFYDKWPRLKSMFFDRLSSFFHHKLLLGLLDCGEKMGKIG